MAPAEWGRLTGPVPVIRERVLSVGPIPVVAEEGLSPLEGPEAVGVVGLQPVPEEPRVAASFPRVVGELVGRVRLPELGPE